MRKLLASLIVGLCTFEGMVQAGELRSGKAAISNSSLDSSSVTLQGNTFNAANKLVQLDAAAALPAGLKVSTASLLSGQNWLPAQLPSTAAYTNTNNNFSGTQDFSGSVNARAPLTVNGSSLTINGVTGLGIYVKLSSVGINAVTPTAYLDVRTPNDSSIADLISFGRSDAAVQAVGGYDGTAGESYFGMKTDHTMNFIQNNTQVGQINSDGVFAFGTNADPIAGYQMTIQTPSNAFVVLSTGSTNAGQRIGNISWGVGEDNSFDIYGGAGHGLGLGDNGANRIIIKGAVTTGAALCLTAAKKLSTCSSVVGADGTCTCN